MKVGNRTEPGQNAQAGMFGQPDPIENASLDELQALQFERFKQALSRAARVPHYQKKFAAEGIELGDIKSLDDLPKFPFTTKEDLRQNYPFGMFAVPMNEVLRVHASSGTTGKPTVVGYTRRDIETWSSIMARSMRAAGGHPGDKMHIAYGYGLFTGGLGFHYGAERIGATVVPISSGFTERQLLALRDFGATVLCCTPSYSLHLAEALGAAGIPPGALRLRVGFFGAEPWTEEMRGAIEARLGLTAFNVYGLSEIMGPGVSVECEEHQGMHVHADHVLPEVVDPATLEPVPPGVTGELVYRTRDLTALDPEPCRCGRTFARIGRITGRTDDMLIVRGVNLFPSQIEQVLLAVPRVEPHYLLVLRREGALDALEIRVEAHPDVVVAGEEAVRRLADLVQRRVREAIGIAVGVTVVPPGSLERSPGKARRIHDLR
jgi:phenylacetate-CoA ligase